MAGEDAVPQVVLDAFALMALLEGEEGASTVHDLLRAAAGGRVRLHMCMVSVAEVFYIVWRRSAERTARTTVADLQLAGVRFDDVTLALSLKAGALRAQFPLALADCFAAALAQELGGTLVTGNPEFKHVEPAVKIEWL